MEGFQDRPNMPAREEGYNSRAAMRTYFPNGYTMSIGLRRARRRYWWPNAKGWAFTGLCIGLVYYYSLEAVAQDNYDDLAPLIPPASVLDRIETIEEANAARRARRAIPAQLLTVEPRPAHLQPFTPNSMPTSFGRFGLGPRMSYYWPKDGTLVPGAPSLIDDDLGEVGERFGSGWMGGGRV